MSPTALLSICVFLVLLIFVTMASLLHSSGNELAQTNSSLQETDAPEFQTREKRKSRKRHGKRRRRGDLSLWIDEEQVRSFSGLSMEIYVIANGHLQPFLLDANLEKLLPNIPTSIDEVKFTWRSGGRRYHYNFTTLETYEPSILANPKVSIPKTGQVPRRAKPFTIHLQCRENRTGTASFAIGLALYRRRRELPGTPIRLRLRKDCTQRYAFPGDCGQTCMNGGTCDPIRHVCMCPQGYMGAFCDQALCYPKCLNGGECVSPGVCRCPPAFQGTHCEGGICQEKCLNGGKCVQKDVCSCSKGFYGPRCQISKCIVPCMNGGRCRGINTCKCPFGFHGNHCQVTTTEDLIRRTKKCRRKRCKHRQSGQSTPEKRRAPKPRRIWV